MTPETLAELDFLSKRLKAVTFQVVADGRAALASGDHVEVIKHFDALRKQNDTIKEAREALSETADLFSKQYIPDIVRELREKSGLKPPFNIDGVGRVSVSYKWSASIVGDDKTVGHAWLKDNGHGALVTETVNSSTLSAFAKDLLTNQGIDLPPEIFKVGQNPYTSITKA